MWLPNNQQGLRPLLEIKLTKDELKAEAKKLGVKVKENWMDDPGENAIIAAIFLIVGILVGKLFL